MLLNLNLFAHYSSQLMELASVDGLLIPLIYHLVKITRVLSSDG